MTADVAIRLSVKDGEIVRTALKNIGRDGEAAWGRIEAGAVRAGNATDRATKPIIAVGKAANDNVPNFRRFGSVAQQAGYQIGDFAVQVASGQNALVALTQQGAQLLGFFGPWGAVLGAVAAVAGALAISLWDTGDAADDAVTSLEAYEKSIKKAEDFIKRLNDQQKTSAELLRQERDEILKTAKARLDAAKAALEIRKAEIEQINRMSNDPMFGIGDEPIDAGVYQQQINEIAELQANFDDLRASMTGAIEANEAFKASEENNKSVKKAADETARQAEKVRDLVAALNAQRDALFQTEREQAISNALMRAGNDITRDQAAQIRDAAGSLYDYQLRIKDLNEALDREQKLMVEGQQVRDATRTDQEKYNEELERLSELRRAGAIDEETYGRAAVRAADDLSRSQERLRKQQEKLNEVGRGFGQAFSSAFEEAALSGAKFSDVLKGLEGDIARVILRASVTKPLENAVGGFDWGGLFGSIAGSFFGGGGATTGPGVSYPAGSTFANGGIMTSRGEVPLRKYASGGVATSPQLALFGEGSMPEAYVPLPDGRNIPVKLQGGGGDTYNLYSTVDATGSKLSRSEIQAIVKTAQDGAVAQVREMQKRKGSARI
ncbi:phage tail length tape measure family protein [Thalassospira sp. SM2505]